jgi:hypothetical protein
MSALEADMMSFCVSDFLYKRSEITSLSNARRTHNNEKRGTPKKAAATTHKQSSEKTIKDKSITKTSNISKQTSKHEKHDSRTRPCSDEWQQRRGGRRQWI